MHASTTSASGQESLPGSRKDVTSRRVDQTDFEIGVVRELPGREVRLFCGAKQRTRGTKVTRVTRTRVTRGTKVTRGARVSKMSKTTREPEG